MRTLIVLVAVLSACHASEPAAATRPAPSPAPAAAPAAAPAEAEPVNDLAEFNGEEMDTAEALSGQLVGRWRTADGKLELTFDADGGFTWHDASCAQAGHAEVQVPETNDHRLAFTARGGNTCAGWRDATYALRVEGDRLVLSAAGAPPLTLLRR
jgi:hypothetical protein